MKKEQVYKILKDKEFIYEVVDYIEKEYGQYILGHNIKTEFNSVKKLIERDGAEANVRVSAILADIWNDAIIAVLNNKDITASRVNNENGKENGDINISCVDGSFLVELKTTRGSDIQGSTHSSNKCESFIFIKYNVDREYEFSENKKTKHFITDIFYAYTPSISKLKNSTWKGSPKHNNSRTTFKVSNDDLEVFREHVINGEISPKKKWIKWIPEKRKESI